MVIALAIVVTSGMTILAGRQDALRDAQEDLDSISSGVVRHMRNSIELSNAILTGVARSLQKSDGTMDQMKTVSEDIAAVSAATTRIREILFAESGGWVLASSLGEAGLHRNVMREPFFRRPLARDAEPFGLTKTTAVEPSIVVSRRVEGLDGIERGVVAATIPEAYFRQTYTTFDTGRGIEVELRGEDGASLLRYGGFDPAAAFEGLSIERRVEPLPYRLIVRRPNRLILREWSSHLPLQALATLALLVLVFAVAHLVARLLTRGRMEQEALARQAMTDPLTGLGNRRALIEGMRAAILAAAEGRSSFAVLLIDLDRFKAINDVHGHLAGDAVLAMVGTALHDVIGRDGLITRLGGDEFAAVVPGLSPAELRATLANLAERIRQPLDWQGSQLNVGVSIGVALCPDHGTDADTLLQGADLAMYQAKHGRDGCIRFFAADLEDRARARRKREAELKLAIERQEIRPYYQPIVAFAGGELVAFELLARWHHPSDGVLAPAEFIELAEECDLITPMTLALLRQAVADAADWPAHIRLAINISPRQLREPLLAHRLIEAVRAGGFDPHRLEVELTEDAILDDYELAKAAMSVLRLNGATLALDDFGMGYSSLSHLRELRFDKLKIDKSFVQALPGNAESRKLVDAILQLASSFGMRVTAEGVETAEQAAFLAGRGCQRGQGYLYGRPADAAATLRLLSGGAPRQGATAEHRSLG
ncbi:putative bifunctional diguanylate cyclase/phosphodiesterase [Aureimonas endophytica]|uniref:putative bifunctional diguanylate cyclase/phosphodiesterase n=1 Tax=Aureimonas endophytica TaxID=2027858 RepID=UPI00166921C5|nr:EAL domain-containing protein [Aureimonas endophytica]